MVISKKTVKYFLCQAKLLDWDNDTKYTTKYLSGRNNNVIFLSSETSFFLKQSMTKNEGIEEGVLQEVYFYSWLKRWSDSFEFKENFIHFYGYEPKNKVAVYEFIKKTQTFERKHLTSELLDNILSLLFCCHEVKWQNEFSIMVKDKPDIWKLINEESTIMELPKQWFEVRNFIKTRSILLQSLDELLVSWKPEFICNADIKLDNFLIEKDTNNIYWIDWERFCLADELWDIGGLLRLLLFEHLKISKDLSLILDNDVFQKTIAQIWKKVHSVNVNVTKDKLLLIWVTSMLEKTLELTQEGSININTAYFLIEVCEEMQVKSENIKHLFH